MQSESLQEVMLNAKLHAMDKKHSKLEPHHVLYSLVFTQNEVQQLLLDYGLTAKKLDIDERGRGGTLTESPQYIAMEKIAVVVSTIVGDKEVNCKHILLAILSQKKSYAREKIWYLLGKSEENVQKLFTSVKKSIPIVCARTAQFPTSTLSTQQIT